jgi:type III restriction enzyme
MTKVFHHLVNFIQEGDNLEYLSPIFSDDKPLISTSSIEYWHTSKPCEYTKKSHINFTTYDSTWEASEAYELDHNSKVVSWVKNDHLGFCIYYSFKGIIRRYYPDFIIKLKNGIHLVLEVKGQEKEIDKVKRNALGDWVTAINQDGRFGKWKSAVSYSINDVLDIIEKS